MSINKFKKRLKYHKRGYKKRNKHAWVALAKINA